MLHEDIIEEDPQEEERRSRRRRRRDDGRSWCQRLSPLRRVVYIILGVVIAILLGLMVAVITLQVFYHLSEDDDISIPRVMIPNTTLDRQPFTNSSLATYSYPPTITTPRPNYNAIKINNTIIWRLPTTTVKSDENNNISTNQNDSKSFSPMTRVSQAPYPSTSLAFQNDVGNVGPAGTGISSTPSTLPGHPGKTNDPRGRGPPGPSGPRGPGDRHPPRGPGDRPPQSPRRGLPPGFIPSSKNPPPISKPPRPPISKPPHDEKGWGEMESNIPPKTVATKRPLRDTFRAQLKDILLWLLLSLVGIGVLLVFTTMICVKVLDARKRRGHRHCCDCCYIFCENRGESRSRRTSRVSSSGQNNPPVEVVMSPVHTVMTPPWGHSISEEGDSEDSAVVNPEIHITTNSGSILRVMPTRQLYSESERQRTNSTGTSRSDPPSYNEAMSSVMNDYSYPPQVPNGNQPPSYEDAISSGSSFPS